jgi:hypothetical protein
MDRKLDKLIPDINFSQISATKILKVYGFTVFISLIFSTILYTFCYGQIKNAYTFNDYIYFGFETLCVSGYGDMSPESTLSQVIISIYLLVVFSFIISLAL